MRHLGMLVVVGLLAGVVLAEEKGKSPTPRSVFLKLDEGKVPTGWKAVKTGEGIGSIWKVTADPTAPAKTGYALAQVNADPKAMFNICVVEREEYRDLTLSVAFKAIKGKKDQGGGLVWRYQDAKNYYIARMNPLEDNFRVYKVVDGKRMQLATTQDNVKVAVGTWHTLTIKQMGKKIECSLDGKKMLEAEDATFPQAGLIGVWSKADAQTHFDELTVKGE